MKAEVTADNTSVRVTWQWTSSGSAPNCFNTTVTYRPEGGGESSSLQLSDPAATEATLTNLQCNTTYTITVVATAEGHRKASVAVTVYLPLQGIPQHACKPNANYVVTCQCTDIPAPFGVKADAIADNTSIRVSWQWSCQGVLNRVMVHYQPKGGSLMMYTVDNTAATSATLANLQCNTKYTIWVHACGGPNDASSVSRLVSLPARGRHL